MLPQLAYGVLALEGIRGDRQPPFLDDQRQLERDDMPASGCVV